MEIQTPHDLFVKSYFGQELVTRPWLKDAVPRWLGKRYGGAVRRVELVPGSFVDPDLQARHSDLLFRLHLRLPGDKRNTQVLVYVLVEHKSTPDGDVVLQLLNYMGAIWRQQRRQRRKPAAILPVVLYHGRRRWHVPLEFQSWLLAPPALEPHNPAFSYVLCDLSATADDQLPPEPLPQAGLLMLKYAMRPQLRSQLSRIFALLAQEGGIELLRTTIHYVLNAGTGVDRAQVLDAVKPAWGSQGEQAVATIAEKLRQEGRQEGWQKGRQEGLDAGRREGLHEGRQEGLDEGRQKGLHEAIRTVATVRFGRPDAATQDAFEAVTDPQRLQRMAQRVAVTNSWADLLSTT